MEIVSKTIDKHKNTPFKAWNFTKKAKQKYDTDNIHIVKAGQKIFLNDFIQEAREDTEIYAMLEKYNGSYKTRTDFEALTGDFTKVKDLRSALEQEKAANELWENLPLNVRNEFNNSKHQFLDNGEKWLANKIAEEKAKQQKQQEETIKENNNG